MDEDLSFGQLIKSLREHRGWSQEQLALITGLADRTIQRIENEQNNPSDTSIIALAHAFEVSFETLQELAEQPQLFQKRFEEYCKAIQDIDFLPRLTNGHEISSILSNCHADVFEHTPLENHEEAELVGGFLQDLRDVGDMWSDLEPIERARTEVRFNECIEELDAYGFWVFGTTKKQKLRSPHLKEPFIWDIAYLFVIRKSEPAIQTLADGKEALPKKLKSSGFKIG